MTGARNLLLDMLRLDGGTQPRAAIDMDIVKSYQEDMLAGAVFPPLVVFHDGANYWLADGFHRFHAMVGIKGSNGDHPFGSFDCDVRQGTQRDAVLYSVGTNAEHGLRRTNEDKRRAVQCLLNDPEWRKWSNRQIAKHCKVDEATVRKWRPQPSAEIPQIAARTVSRGGVVYEMNTSRIGGRPDPDGAVFDNTPMGTASDNLSFASAEQGRRDIPAFGEGDPEISAALREIEYQFGTLPTPTSAMQRFRPSHYHAFSSRQLREMSRWFASFADEFEKTAEGYNVAAE